MRYLLFSLLSVFLLPFMEVGEVTRGSCGRTPDDSLSLVQVLKGSVSPGEILYEDDWDIIYGDLDGDLRSELLVGTQDGSDGSLRTAGYLVREGEVTVLDPLHSSDIPSKVEVYNLGGDKVILSHQSLVLQGQSYSTNHVLSKGMVRDMGLTPSLFRDYVGLGFRIRSEAADERTEHLYYVYYDGQTLREYEGEEISTHEFTFFVGGMAIMTRIMQDGVRISDIFYRNNGTVDVNCYRQTDNGRECFYYTYQILGGVPYLVLDEYGEVMHQGCKLSVSGVIP